MVLILLLAFALRAVYALHFAPPLSFVDDDTFFFNAGKELAHGQGYVTPLAAFFRVPSLPTAEHPPLYPVLLAGLSKAGVVSINAERMLNVVIGTVTTLLVGLVAGRISGRRAALVAAGLCATYPAFVASDGAIMSETLFAALVAATLLQALRLLSKWSWPGLVGLGALIALATLTRSEGLLLWPLLVVPIATYSPARRIATITAAAAGCVIVLAPWVIRNWVELGRPLLSDNQGITLAGANCNSTYYGSQIAGFDAACIPSPGRLRREKEAAASSQAQSHALTYVKRHRARAIVIAGARVAAVWGLYAPGRQAVVTGRNVTWQKAGVAMYYALLVLGIVGAITLSRRRRRRDLLVLLTPCVVTSVTAALTYGLVRLRSEAEISLLVAAAIALTSTATTAKPQDWIGRLRSRP